MKNNGKKVMCLIFGTVIVLWSGFTLPQWLRTVPTGQVESGKSGARHRSMSRNCMALCARSSKEILWMDFPEKRRRCWRRCMIR